MDDDGAILPPGGLGEVVIRGRNVTAGYENNPDANAKAFTNGWFRTGDQGVLDEQGYLRLTGRLKEIINRGGEKISPLEVDTVLMDHPAVAQALTFAMPHAKLGEEVAAAIVLREGADVRRARAARLRGRAPCRVQGAAQDRLSGRNPEGGDRQAAAHRAGREARSGRREDRRSSAPARSAACWASGWPQAGADVTFIARGPHLAAMQANGVTLVSGETRTVRASALPRRRRRGGGAGLRGRHAEGAWAARGGAADRAHDGAGQRAGDRHQRRALLVFLRPRRAVSRPARSKASIRAGGCGTCCRRRRRSAAWSIRPPR